MTIGYETVNIASGSGTGTGESFSHSLQNASGNDRLVTLSISASSNQSGNLGISSPTYNGNAPSGTIVTAYGESGPTRDIMVTYYWLDSNLPATAGSYTVAYSITNQGASPLDTYAVIERTGVDQTTPIQGTPVTNNGFGTTTQTYSPGAGTNLEAMLGWNRDQTVTASWGTGDVELKQLEATVSTYYTGYAIAYTTDSSISGTLSANSVDDIWSAWAVNASAGGGTITVNGTPQLQNLTASGQIDIVNTVAGTPQVQNLTASGQVDVVNTISGTPQIQNLAATGIVNALNTISGAPQLQNLTASGLIAVINKIAGAPQLQNLTATGVITISGLSFDGIEFRLAAPLHYRLSAKTDYKLSRPLHYKFNA